jgi:hypothetical protein
VPQRCRIFAADNINAFFGLMLDNMSGLVILATILIFIGIEITAQAFEAAPVRNEPLREERL